MGQALGVSRTMSAGRLPRGWYVLGSAEPEMSIGNWRTSRLSERDDRSWRRGRCVGTIALVEASALNHQKDLLRALTCVDRRVTVAVQPPWCIRAGRSVPSGARSAATYTFGR